MQVNTNPKAMTTGFLTTLIVLSSALAAETPPRAQEPQRLPSTAMTELRSRQDTRSSSAIMRRIGAGSSESTAREMADSLASYALIPTGVGTDAVLAQRASVHALAGAAKVAGGGVPLAHAGKRLAEVARSASSFTIRFIAMRELPEIRDRELAISTLVQIAFENGSQSRMAVEQLMLTGDQGIKAAKDLYSRRSELPWGRTRFFLEANAKARGWN